MKLYAAVALGLLVAASCSLWPPAKPRLTGPVAGQWQVTVTAAGMALPPQKVCYEKQMTMEDTRAMQQDSGMTCSEQVYSADGKSGHSVCTMQDMTITSDFTATGDFETAYTMEMTTSIIPALPGAQNPSVTMMKMERLGDCKTGTPAP